MSIIKRKNRMFCTKRSFFYSLFLAPFIGFFSLPLFAEGCAADPSCHSSYGIKAEARVAYYRPSSKKVREIYGDGWADYQLELSKTFKGFWGAIGDKDNYDLNDIEWSIWTGVSGFSKNGESIGLHDDTNLQLIPINVGVKIFYPLFCKTKIFVGGAACYSLLRIHDKSEYVHEHTSKGGWGGLIQSGLHYQYCDWMSVSAFFDYYFQQFDFHSSKDSSSYESGYNQKSRYIERSNLNMSGYKLGVGLGFLF